MKRLSFLVCTVFPSVALAHPGHPHYVGSESHLVEAVVGLAVASAIGVGTYAFLKRRRRAKNPSHS